MRLEGSCDCRAVRFSVDAYAPWPYLRSYCGICRKTAGSGGFAINLGAHAATLKVKGRRADLRAGHASAEQPIALHPVPGPRVDTNQARSASRGGGNRDTSTTITSLTSGSGTARRRKRPRSAPECRSRLYSSTTVNFAG